MNVREYLEILHVAERLKDTPRHCTTTKGRTESVAEHSWRVSLIASLLKHEFPDLDTDKVVNMCLIHDLGECFTGDIPTFVKTDSDRNVEDTLLDQWVKTLPEEISSDIRTCSSFTGISILPFRRRCTPRCSLTYHRNPRESYMPKRLSGISDRKERRSILSRSH